MNRTHLTQTDSRTSQREGIRTMGASRDFTTGATAGTGVMERTRGQAVRGNRAVVPTRPVRRQHRPELPQRSSRLGSKQVVSFRGRQLRQPLQKQTSFTRLSIIAISLLITGVAIAMWLSGISTAQTFKIQQLTVQESQLDNQLETLNRDLENVSSSADVARRANEMHMAIPVQPGVVEVRENGDIAEKRPAKPETESIIDVNGEPVRPGQASSDPNETSDMSDSLSAVPQGQQRSPGDDRAPRGAGDAAAARGGDQPQDAGRQAPAGEAAPPQLPAQAPYANRG